MGDEILFLDDIITALVKRDPKYESLLREIVAVDIAFEPDSFGWQMHNVSGLSGGHIPVLLQNRIIKYGYKSNSATHFRLAIDGNQLATILDALREGRIQQTYKPDVILAPELIQEFEQLISQDTDMVSYWAHRLNPRIIGMERERQACLISLASPADKQGLMRRCHTLIWGPPGTAKSILITYIKHYLDAVGISPTSSEAGLKIDARGQGTAGALVMAHNKTLVAEELDKFDRKTLEAMYEAMSTGEFDVNKGDIRETFKAEIRVIAVGNEIERLPKPLLDRFDMTFYYEIPSKEAEKKITDDIYMQWITGKEDYKGHKLRAYLEYIKDYEPEINSEMLDKCMRIKNAYIDLSDKKPDVREKEAFLKVAFVIARINHRELKVQDYLKAITLVDPSFIGARYNALEILAKELAK